jgi:hypothetical protein
MHVNTFKDRREKEWIGDDLLTYNAFRDKRKYMCKWFMVISWKMYFFRERFD